jgi:SRSO17 transposase
MEARFEVRKRELLDACTIVPDIYHDVMARLDTFLIPFVANFGRREQVEHATTFVRGLISDVETKNVESIAYRFGQERMPLQHFIGFSEWNDEPLRAELVRQVAQELGDPHGVIVLDPSGFAKSGKHSVGVARQWCGRKGKIDNCQVAVMMGYVSRHEHALVDSRLYLPKEWTDDRPRCRRAGVPKRTRHRTRHQLSLEMLKLHRSQLPHRWIAGDDEMGRPYHFRRDLHDLGEQYFLAVPSTTLIRDLEVDRPPYTGRGPYPDRPWIRVDRWAAARRLEDWTRIEVRDGAKGPLVVEIIKRHAAGRTPQRQEGHSEMLVVIRYRDRDDKQVVKTDYYLSNAHPETELAEFARVSKAEHRIEECIQRSKSEAGLAEYEVRNWTGWHHHQTLSLLATWFLVTETRRGKKMDTGYHAPTDSGRHCRSATTIPCSSYDRRHSARARETIAAQRTRSLVSLETT